MLNLRKYYKDICDSFSPFWHRNVTQSCKLRDKPWSPISESNYAHF